MGLVGLLEMTSARRARHGRGDRRAALLGDLIRELDGGGVVSGALRGRAGQPDQAVEAARVKAEARGRAAT